MDVDQRRARREARRREVSRRRKRGLAAVAIVAVAAMLVAIVLGSGGSTKSGADNASAGGSGAAGHAGSKHGQGGTGGAGSNAGASKSGSSNTGGSGAGENTLKGTAPPGSGPKGTEAVPILMYHVINPPPEGAKFPGLYVDPEEFEAQMKALTASRLSCGDDGSDARQLDSGGTTPRGKPIVVSFDNGYQSQLTKALPVLRRLGWVGVENIQLTGLPPSQGGLSKGQVEQLVKEGWELDTQGISHADLITLGAAALHEQVTVAREEVGAFTRCRSTGSATPRATTTRRSSRR